jgi:hypothetical protein
LTNVPHIPYFVREQFLITHAPDRSKRAAVERQVVQAYERYLMEECIQQTQVKRNLERRAQHDGNAKTRAQKVALARQFELTRCAELQRFFPGSS